MADGDLPGRAFVVVVVPAGRDLARPDAGMPPRIARVRRRCQERVATRMNAVADRDGAGVAAVVRIVGAFGDGTLADDRHVDRYAVHDGLSRMKRMLG